MSKYNFELDLDSENSLSLIIDMIKPNSKILEFGPAHGRLTKYLKESMNCIVDIVEIDENAGIEASKHANKFFIGNNLGNIENYKWLESLKNERYDYIVFADILEHLYWPVEVLKKCKNILKDEGNILLSVPNIAHNSVIIDLINDEFKYNKLGLLDNTHIRFFTYNSLTRMLREAGFIPTIERATYNKVGENEIINSYDSIDRYISKGLRNREKGNIYQFVFAAKKIEPYLKEETLRYINLDKLSYYETVIYIKDEFTNEYSESKTIRKSIYSNSVHIRLDISKYNLGDEIRLDPINTNCIIDNLSIYTINENKKTNLSISKTNANNTINKKYIFETEDPQIYVITKNIESNEIFIQFDIIDYDITYINEIINIEWQLNQILRNKDNHIEKVENELRNKDNHIEKVENELRNKDDHIEKVENELRNKDDHIEKVENELRNKDDYIEKIEGSIIFKLIKKFYKF